MMMAVVETLMLLLMLMLMLMLMVMVMVKHRWCGTHSLPTLKQPVQHHHHHQQQQQQMQLFITLSSLSLLKWLNRMRSKNVLLLLLLLRKL
jgi:UDP-N-acetylmuramyl pentapeptide phosphotransferase/UDP-N-acetylglucosamine-1-phosphate transferase